MKIKKIINGCVAILTVFLFFFVPEQVLAGTHGSGSSSDFYECSRCGGDWQSYFREEINDPYVFYVLGHNKNSDGTWTCDNYGYNRLMDHEVGGYYIRYNVLNEQGQYDMNYGYIFISEDTNFDTTTYGGEVVIKRYSEYTSSNYAGESNNKYYIGWIHSGLYYPFELNNGDFDFIVEVDKVNNQKNQYHELARYLCGETTELPSGVTVAKESDVYDLEPPLDIKVNATDATKNVRLYGDGLNNSLHGGSNTILTPYKIWWNQSNIDLTGYETEFLVRDYGKYKKSAFSSWTEINTSWCFDKSLVTGKYCNNSLKYYEYNCREEQRLFSYIEESINDEPYNVEFYYPDFMIRNTKKDESGQMHYSNWVYVKIYEDGTYSVFEMKKDYDITEDSDETGNIDTDSPNYDDEVIYEDTDYSPDVGGVTDASKFVRVLKDLANSLGDFPDLFAQIFSFLPGWVLVCIGTLFVVIMLRGIF